ncbi:MAG: hypothetical protein ABI646_04750, partial [Acidobacteriota bacterium]
VKAADNVYKFFESTAGKQIVVRVGPSVDGKGSREVTVVPVGTEEVKGVHRKRRTPSSVWGLIKSKNGYLPDTRSFDGTHKARTNAE